MKRARLSQVLATCLGGGPLMLLATAMDPRCDPTVFKGEMQPVKLDVSAVKVNVNVNLGGSNGEAAQAPGMDERAGQKGPTEVEGTVQHGCLSDGKTCW